jgi:hypothetical protein
VTKEKAKTAKKMKVKTEKSADKLSKGLKEQINALIEKATKGTHKSLAKIEKQLQSWSGKKASVKAKPATKPKKKMARKKKPAMQDATNAA